MPTKQSLQAKIDALIEERNTYMSRCRTLKKQRDALLKSIEETKTIAPIEPLTVIQDGLWEVQGTLKLRKAV